MVANGVRRDTKFRQATAEDHNPFEHASLSYRFLITGSEADDAPAVKRRGNACHLGIRVLRRLDAIG